MMNQEADDTRGNSDTLLAPWQAVLQQMPAGVMIARAGDGEIIFANTAAVDILGHPDVGSEALSRHRELRGFHSNGDEYTVEEWPLVRSLRRGEIVSDEEIDIQLENGTRVSMSVSSSPVRDSAGTVTAAVVTFTDITSRKRDEAARRFIAQAGAVLSSSLDYTVTLGNIARLAVPTLADWCAVDIIQNGKIRRLAAEHVDPAKVRLAQELGDRYPPDLDAPGGVGEVLRTGRSVIIPEITREMLVGSARDEEHLEILLDLDLRSAMIVPLVARGKTLGDITLIAAESGRSFSASDLALAEELAALAALAADNSRLYDDSQAANRAKADFLSVISHELRTPLTAVIGYAELLALGIPEPLTTKQCEQIERIEIAARHLLQLIEEILTISSLDAGTVAVRFRPVSLSEVLRRAETIARPLSREKNLPLRIDIPSADMELHTDPDRLLQVIINLLSNAVKFTDSGGVELTARELGDRVEISVSDSGIGIEKAHRERIFDAFWQAEQPITRRVGGTGLGLTISKRLIHLLHGDIAVASEPGRGSTFTLTLPLASASGT